jgi:polysaccharide biosynthesis transport protein
VNQPVVQITRELQTTATIGVGDVMRGMLRRMGIVLLCLALGLLAGYLINKIFKPSYVAEARILVEKRDTRPTTPERPTQVEAQLVPADNREIAAQTNIIAASDMLTRVARKLNLAERSEFNPPASSSALNQFLVDWGFVDDTSRLSSEQKVNARLASKVTVYPIPETNIIGIKYSSSDPEVAAAVANAIADMAIFSSEERQSGSAGRNREWLARQVEMLREKVTESERKAETFRTENGLITGERAALNVQKISEVSTQITLAETTKSEADARLREIKRATSGKGGIDATSDVLNSTTIQGLANRLTEARSKLSELRATYLDRHPKIVAVRNDIQSIERQIKREASKIAASIEGQAKIADSRLRTLRTSLKELETKAGGFSQKEITYRELERDTNANRKLLEELLARYAQANASQTNISDTQSTIRA